MSGVSALARVAVLLVAVAVVEGAASKEEDKFSWGHTLAQCTEGMASSHASKCLADFETVARNGSIFTECDKEYCRKTNQLGADGVCKPAPEACTGCKCLHDHYAAYMECTVKAMQNQFTSKYCTESGVAACIEGSKGAYIDECKRGVDQGRISWMDTPLPTGCDRDVVCAGMTASPVAVLSLLSVLAVLLLS